MESEEVAKIYSDLYDSAFREFNGFLVNVYYERDIEILEKHADEAAEEFYKQQSEEKSKYQNRGHQKDFGHKKHFRDDVSTKSDTSKNQLAGFHTGGPIRYYNKKKNEGPDEVAHDTESTHKEEQKVEDAKDKQEIAKQAKIDEKNDIVEQKAETKTSTKDEIVKDLKEEKKELKSDSKKDTAKEVPKEVPLVRRDTDNEFEITIGNEKSGWDVLTNKVDVVNLEEDKVSKDEKQPEVILNPRHHKESSGLTRAPWGDRYRNNNLKAIEKHIQSKLIILKNCKSWKTLLIIFNVGNKEDNSNIETKSKTNYEKNSERKYDQYSSRAP